MSDRIKAVVTGGAGFIGSRLCERLMEQDIEVSIIDCFYEQRYRIIPKVPPRMSGLVRLFPVDIGNRSAMMDCVQSLRGTQLFFHLAAHFASDRSLVEPDVSVRTNVIGTVHCLEVADKIGVEVFCYASSSGVYGDKEDGVYKETDPPSPLSPYETGKYAGELLALGWGRMKKKAVVCPRYFNVYGIGDTPGVFRSVIPRFYQQALAGVPLTVTGRDTARDFVYVDDVVEYTMLAATGALRGTFPTQTVFNVATGEATTSYALAEKIIELTGSKSEIQLLPQRSWDNALVLVGDTTRLRELFPRVAQTQLNVGLMRSHGWYVRACS